MVSAFGILFSLYQLLCCVAVYVVVFTVPKFYNSYKVCFYLFSARFIAGFVCLLMTVNCHSAG